MKKGEYIINSNDIQNLKKLGFRHIGDGVYVLEFTGYKWRGFVTITCRFTAFDDNKTILIDVFTENGEYYSPYYKDEKTNSVLSVIKSNITKEIKRCKIEYKENSTES